MSLYDRPFPPIPPHPANHPLCLQDSNIASITDYLSSSRQSYLSTSAPPRTRTRHNTTQEREYLTDSQRDEIDSESKATLSKLATRIQDLEAAEHTRRQAVTLTASKRKKYGLGRLGAWAAGDVGGTSAKSPEESLVEAREAHLAECRDSVVWYLRLKLEGAMGKQREMMERRMEREVERGKSVLHKIKGSSDTGVTGEGGALVDGRGTGNSSTTNSGALKDLYGRDGGTGYVGSAVSLDEKDRKGIEQSLSPEQLQLFEQENNDMLNRYNDQIGQVRYVHPFFSSSMQFSNHLRTVCICYNVCPLSHDMSPAD